MSYGLKFRVEKGFVSLESMSGQVPEGTFEITGHVDPSREDLGVHRREPDGRFAGSAYHSHPAIPAAPDPDPAEGF